MRRFLLMIGMVVTSAALALGAHNVVLTWTNSPDTANTNVWRLAGTCPAPPLTGFTQLNATSITTATYTDSAVTAGSTYCYYVTAILNGTNSGPSSTVTATIPVAPPSGLSIQSVAEMLRTGGKVSVLAKFGDSTKGASTTATLYNSSVTLATASFTPSLKEISWKWAGADTLPIYLKVCDTTGACVTQEATVQ